MTIRAVALAAVLAVVGCDRDTTPARAPAAAPPAPAAEWAGLGDTMIRDGVAVKLRYAKVGSVRLYNSVDDTKGPSTTRYFSLGLSVHNPSKTLKVDYLTWQGGAPAHGSGVASLVDEYGNQYKRVEFHPFEKPVQRTEEATIYPGQTIDDILVFEQPTKVAQELRLELPGANVSKGGETFRFKIPAMAIEHAD